MSPRVRVLNIEVDRTRGDAVLRRLRERVVGGEVTSIAYVNAHTLNLAVVDSSLARALGHATFVLNDGAGLAIAGILKRKPFAENLNGSDFTLRVLQLCADESWGVFLLGSRIGVAERAGQRLSEAIPNLRIVGTHHGFEDDPSVEVRKIRDAGAEVVLVAKGNPTQEIWIERRLAETGAHTGVAVGAFLDFQAGAVKRAPKWLNRIGFEWLYRLTREPQRLWRRYVLGNPIFMMRLIRDIWQR